MKTGAYLFAALFAVGTAVPAAASPGISTFAPGCQTPKTTFNLGDTVCARAEGLVGLRFQWVDPDGFSVAILDITQDPQITTFTLPATSQSAIGAFFIANNLGRWRVNAITSRNSAKLSSFLTVRDPANAKVDLSIVKSTQGGELPSANGPFQFLVSITNNGPDDAINTRFVDNVFSNASFNSIVQTGGPTFTCNGADCQIASLPNGSVATFLLNFTAGSEGAVLTNRATVSSDTAEMNPGDNTAASADSPIGAQSSNPLPECNPQVTAPPPVTLYTGANASACSVTVADVDALLGQATGTDTCTVIGGVTRSGVPEGNVFPVGVTTITYAITDDQDISAVATQTVTVIDNAMPAITCPGNVTLEPTCPAGAVGSWTEPAGTDNCASTTAQTAGPLLGSTIPIGTTNSVTYTVTDASGNQASCSFTVTVLTAQATLQNVKASINASSMSQDKKDGLTSKLDAIVGQISRGDSKPACNVLSAFTNLVEKDISLGVVSAVQGQAWITSANHVGNTIGCTSNACM